MVAAMKGESFRSNVSAGVPVANVSQPVQRAIIRTGSVSLRVDQLQSAESRLRKIAASEGGWIDGLDGGEESTVATLRVPSDRFDATMASVLALGKPLSRKVSQEDVTDQIVDLGARMKALRAEEAAYVGMLAQTRSLSDTLEVRSRLGSVRQEIEQADASRTNLARKAAMSTLEVTLMPMPVATPQGNDPGWFSASLADAVGTFGGLVRSVVAVGIYLIVFSPLWIPALWILRRVAKSALVLKESMDQA
ncbi:hypothetical protein BH11ARM2_BH11ARM2_14860 [soil metagenome]